MKAITSPFEDDENSEGRHLYDGEHRHQLGAEKNDGTELTVTPVEGHPVDENDPASTDGNIRLEGPVDTVIPGGAYKVPETSEEDLAGGIIDIKVPTCDIDLDSIAVDQDFAAMAAMKPDSSAPPIRKPGNQLWFSPHPEQKFWWSFLTVKDESDSDTIHVLDRKLAGDLQGEYNTTLFVPCITKQEEVFFWPIKLPDSEGRIDSWNTSKLEHAVAGAGKWMRLRSNQFAGGYDKLSPLMQPTPPTWPDDIGGLLKKAVNKVYIGSLEHPLIKRLVS